MIKVGEHITLDIIGTKKEYESSFFESLVHKIAEKAKEKILKSRPPLLFESSKIQSLKIGNIIMVLLYFQLLIYYISI